MKFTRNSLVIYLAMYMSIIFILSHIPSGTDSQIDYIRFKWLTQEIGNLLHIPLFAGLSYLWIKYFQCQSRAGKSLVIKVLLICGLYAISDELHQYFIPGRFASFSDWVLDIIGVVLVLKFHPLIDRVLRVQISKAAIETVN